MFNILIDTLIKDTNTDTGVVHLVPLESIAASSTTAIIEMLKSI